MDLQQILQAARTIATETLAPEAAAVDREGRWPSAGIRRLLESPLSGLVIPRRHGGLGQGLLGLSKVCETLAAGCPSTAMCFGMHAVASAVIAARATAEQVTQFIEPIVAGRHLTTLALSEAGTGAHFYIPQTIMTSTDQHYLVTGQKSFITSGGRADSYVVSVAPAEELQSGRFSCIVVPAAAEGMRWRGDWDGFGMRGNSSKTVDLRNVRVPKSHLLSAEGDQIWFVFEIIAPYFIMAMSGVYLGIAHKSLALAIDSVRQRRHGHNGLPLAKRDVIQYQIGELWANVERSRQLMYSAATAFDDGEATALPAVLSVKAEAAQSATHVTNEAMTLAGGRTYGQSSELARLLRDARAAHVMAPTTDFLRLWVGRSVLGEPMLADEVG